MNPLVLTLTLLLVHTWEPAPPPPSAPLLVQETKAVAPEQAPSVEALVARFTKYEVALIRKGPKWTKDAPAKIEQLAAKRGNYWKSLVEQGKLVGVARLAKPTDIWGIIFFKVDSKDEMNTIVAEAPAVKEGLLTATVQTVWGSRGLGSGLAKEPAPSVQPQKKGGTYYLVTTAKGPKWSDKADSPETREAAGEAMKYLYGLYKEGSLRYFAALEDFSLKVRTLSIMKVSSAEEAMKLAQGNPAVKNGTHVTAVYEVRIPDGVIP